MKNYVFFTYDKIDFLCCPKGTLKKDAIEWYEDFTDDKINENLFYEIDGSKYTMKTEEYEDKEILMIDEAINKNLDIIYIIASTEY